MEKRQHSTLSCKTGNEVHYVFNVLCVSRTISEAKRRSVMFWRATDYSAGNFIFLFTGFRLFEYKVCGEY